MESLNPQIVTRVASKIFLARKPCGVRTKETQVITTKPVPQKISTILESFNTRLITHNRVMKNRIISAVIP